MQNNLIKNSIVLGLIVLFIGVTVQPCIAIVQPETELDVEPKYYLFQTIIDIANNPEVNILFELYRNDLYRVDVDRSVYRKLLLRNPRLFSSLLFTKPSMTHEYLNKCYNKGIEIINILGEDKALELIESIGVSDTEVFDEFNNIISKDEELSNRLATLKETNKEQNSDWYYPIICSILTFLAMPFEILYDLHKIFQDFYFISLFIAFIVTIGIPYWFVIVYLAWGFDCF